MKIDLTKIGLTEAPASGASRANSTDAREKKNDGVSAVDQTSFSFDRTRVNSLQAEALAQPEVRAAKVQALQQAISKGLYAVSPSQLATAMIRDRTGSEE